MTCDSCQAAEAIRSVVASSMPGSMEGRSVTLDLCERCYDMGGWGGTEIPVEEDYDTPPGIVHQACGRVIESIQVYETTQTGYHVYDEETGAFVESIGSDDPDTVIQRLYCSACGGELSAAERKQFWQLISRN